jgi:hypothetical protein
VRPPAGRRFSYYDRLTAKEKATYRKSDAVGAIDLPNASALAARVSALEVALESGKRFRVAQATTALVTGILAGLGLSPLVVHVREVRPQISGGELHGLYTFAEGDRAPKLEVWMRTAAHAKVVRFRTFLRTLLHEIVHHLDVTLLGLDDSFHTDGFFLEPRSPALSGGAPTRGRREQARAVAGGTPANGPLLIEG